MRCSSGEDVIVEDTFRSSFSRRLAARIAGAVATLFTFGALLVATVALLAGTALRDDLLRSDFLRKDIELALSDMTGREGKVAVGALDVRPRANGLVEVSLSDVALPLPNGSLLEIEQVRLGLKLLPILRKRVEIATIRVSGVRLDIADHLVRRSDLAWNERLERFEIASLLSAVGTPVGALEATMRARNIDAIRLSNVRLSGLDRLGLRTSEAQIVDLRLERDSLYKHGLALAGTVRVGEGNMRLSGDWSAPAENDAARTLRARIEGLDLALLPRFRSGTPTPLEVDAGMSVAASLPFDPDGKPLRGSATLAVGSGRVWFGAEEATSLDRVVLDLRLDPARNSIALLRGTLGTSSLTGKVSGGVAFKPGLADFEFVLSSFKSRAGGVGEDRPGALRISGGLRTADKILALDELRFAADGNAVAASGEIDLAAWTPGIRMSATIPSLEVETLKAYWPPFIAQPVRRWLVGGGASDGVLRDARVDLDIPVGAIGRLRSGGTLGPGELSMTLPVSGGSIRLPGSLPSITRADGVVRVAGVSVAGRLGAGTVAVPKGGVIDVAGSSLSVADFLVKGLPARVETELSGGAKDILVLAGTEPLRIDKAIGIEPSDAHGLAKVSASLRTPLKIEKGAGIADWSATVEIASGRLDRPFKGRRIEAADISLAAEPGLVRIEGTATVDGHRTRLSLIEPFGTNPDGIRAERRVALRLDEAGRRRLGLDLGPWLKGKVDVWLKQQADGWQSVDVDLTAAVLELDFLGWRKGGGVPGRAGFKMRVRDGRTEIADLSVVGSSFNGRGSARMDKAGLRSIDLSNVTMGGTRDMRISAKRTDKGYAIDVDGTELDARPMLATFSSGGGQTSSSPRGARSNAPLLRVTAKLARVLGHDGQVIENAQVSLRYGAKGIADLAVSGSLNGRSLALSTREVGDASALRIDAKDAGALLRFANLYGKMRGGQLVARLTKNAGRYSGPVRFLDFSVTGEKKLQQLMVGGQNSRQKRTDRIVVAEASATITSSKQRLSVSDGRLRGGDMAATFEGLVYDKRGRMKLKGTFLPAYGLNRMVSAIPFIGLAAGSGRTEGLLGITFRLNGPWRSPQLAVNPLSMLAPGVFRKIFE